MAIYYDLEDMELGNSRLRTQYVLRYAIKIILAAYRAVTETAKSNSSEIQKRLALTVAELIDTDEEVDAGPPQFKEELKQCPSLLSNSPKERENMWKRALNYKKDIKNWNSRAPPAKDVPSGETDPTAWRHLKIRQRLFVEKNTDKTEDDMPNHYQPSIVWPAYVALELINDHKFNVVDRDDDDEPLKARTKSRTQQRDDSRLTKIPKKTYNEVTIVQLRHQHNAEQLILQKGRELQKGQSTDLFQSSLAVFHAARDGALDLLPPGIKAQLLQQAGASTGLALQSMHNMVKNPCPYVVAKLTVDDVHDAEAGTVTDVNEAESGTTGTDNGSPNGGASGGSDSPSDHVDHVL